MRIPPKSGDSQPDPHHVRNVYAGWWFGTCFIVHNIYEILSFPLTVIFFKDG